MVLNVENLPTKIYEMKMFNKFKELAESSDVQKIDAKNLFGKSYGKLLPKDYKLIIRYINRTYDIKFGSKVDWSWMPIELSVEFDNWNCFNIYRKYIFPNLNDDIILNLVKLGLSNPTMLFHDYNWSNFWNNEENVITYIKYSKIALHFIPNSFLREDFLTKLIKEFPCDLSPIRDRIRMLGFKPRFSDNFYKLTIDYGCWFELSQKKFDSLNLSCDQKIKYINNQIKFASYTFLNINYGIEIPINILNKAINQLSSFTAHLYYNPNDSISQVVGRIYNYAKRHGLNLSKEQKMNMFKITKNFKFIKEFLTEDLIYKIIDEEPYALSLLQQNHIELTEDMYIAAIYKDLKNFGKIKYSQRTNRIGQAAIKKFEESLI